MTLVKATPDDVDLLP